MRSALSFVVVLFLPVILCLDIVIFFGASQNVTCLSCELPNYLKTSSLSFMVVNEAWQSIRRLI